jgi:hypothetical protein
VLDPTDLIADQELVLSHRQLIQPGGGARGGTTMPISTVTALATWPLHHETR